MIYVVNVFWWNSQHCPLPHPPLAAPWFLENQALLEDLCLPSLQHLLFLPEECHWQSGIHLREDGKMWFSNKVCKLTGLPAKPTGPGSPASPSSPWDKRNVSTWTQTKFMKRLMSKRIPFPQQRLAVQSSLVYQLVPKKGRSTDFSSKFKIDIIRVKKNMSSYLSSDWTLSTSWTLLPRWTLKPIWGVSM